MQNHEVICSHTGRTVPYDLVAGFDLRLIIEMNQRWGEYKTQIISEMLDANPQQLTDQSEVSRLFALYNLEDFGWDWVKKAAHYNTDEYKWFFLVVEGAVQAACIIYHPKQSLVDSENIFYVDYLATAYWNRNRPNYTRQFAGLGTILLAMSIKYAIEVLKYRPGFCLHSLPNAESYYVGLGMQDFGNDKEKENLKFFEADSFASQSLLERYYG